MLLPVVDDAGNVGDDAFSDLMTGDECLFDRVKLANNSLLVDRSVEYGAVEDLQTSGSLPKRWGSSSLPV